MSCCRLCCRQCKGWWRAFTKTEVALACIELLLLVLLIGFLTFLVLHLMSCYAEQAPLPHLISTSKPTQTSTLHRPGHGVHGELLDFEHTGTDDTLHGEADFNYTGTEKLHTFRPSDDNQGPILWKKGSSTRCTATEPNANATEAIDEALMHDRVSTVVDSLEDYKDSTTKAIGKTTDILDEEESDGELADGDEKSVVIALVKIKPSGLTFGCILTILSNHWTVTAASCIDSIEEVDSLDSFVMMDNYGEENKGQSHAVTDVRVHPQYEGGNSSYDLALLKTDDALGKRAVELPTLVDYFRITIGEKMAILGFGNFRSIDQGPLGQRVRTAGVHSLPHAQCISSRDSGLRHLIPQTRELHARCAAAPLCAGVRFARGSPCNYCAGAPLLSRLRLLGIMADNGACGSACEPAFYANVAALRPWLAHIIA